MVGITLYLACSTLALAQSCAYRVACSRLLGEITSHISQIVLDTYRDSKSKLRDYRSLGCVLLLL